MIPPQEGPEDFKGREDPFRSKNPVGSRMYCWLFCSFPVFDFFSDATTYYLAQRVPTRYYIACIQFSSKSYEQSCRSVLGAVAPFTNESFLLLAARFGRFPWRTLFQPSGQYPHQVDLTTTISVLSFRTSCPLCLHAPLSLISSFDGIMRTSII